MNTRKITIAVLTIILAVAVIAGAMSALTEVTATGPAGMNIQANLHNVRAYAAAVRTEAKAYAVDGGALFMGEPGAWVQVPTPQNVIVGAVATDVTDANVLYIGAANELAIYRTLDNGRNWLRVPLTDEPHLGGVTSMSVDGFQRLIYVGTDTSGLFRMRDVGSSVILGGHLLLDEPVLQVVTDSSGQGMAFVRTEWNLYRAENYGLAWVTVDNLKSVPTALAIANSTPTMVYVGTMDRGLLVSQDGLEWTLANEGLGFVPGSRLQVNALAVDPVQPQVLYVATSFLYGTSEVHEAPAGVAVSTDGALAWSPIFEASNMAVTELLPISGLTGGVMALTADSRAPLALGNAPVIEETAVAVAPQPATRGITGILAWIIAGLAALALVVAMALDVRSRRPEPAQPLATSSARNDR